jgi:DNA polymerase III subunit chi
MSEIDFYTLKLAGARERYACRLADKAYRLGHRVHIHTQDAGQAQRMDELLWTFADGSFVPHEQHHAIGDEHPPVVIAAGVEPLSDRDLLLNLAAEVPSFADRFERIADFVDGDESVREAGRLRWRTYKDGGHTVRNHEIEA